MTHNDRLLELAARAYLTGDREEQNHLLQIANDLRTLIAWADEIAGHAVRLDELLRTQSDGCVVVKFGRMPA
jgi:hypothetical protein